MRDSASNHANKFAAICESIGAAQFSSECFMWKKYLIFKVPIFSAFPPVRFCTYWLMLCFSLFSFMRFHISQKGLQALKVPRSRLLLACCTWNIIFLITKSLSSFSFFVCRTAQGIINFNIFYDAIYMFLFFSLCFASSDNSVMTAQERILWCSWKEIVRIWDRCIASQLLQIEELRIKKKVFMN